MNTRLLREVYELAGPERTETFSALARFALNNGLRSFVETGCYRGIPGDGMSTLILEKLAAHVGGGFKSLELNPECIARAKAMLADNGVTSPRVQFIQGDSVASLGAMPENSIHVLYLDSFDHDPANPGPCQQHQLAEIKAALHAMTPVACVLLDDHVPSTGGKTFLSSAFLKEGGWHLQRKGLQLFFTR